MKFIVFTFMALLTCSTASAGEYSLDDIVLAAQRGLPPATLLMMAGDAGTRPLTPDQAVRLLRSGVPRALVDHMTAGAHPTATELAASKKDGPRWKLPDSHDVSVSADEDEEEARFRAVPTAAYRFRRGFRVCTSSLQGVDVTMLLAMASEQAWVSVSLANGSRSEVVLSPDMVSLERRRDGVRANLQRISPDELASAYESSWWLDYLEERSLVQQAFSVHSSGSADVDAHASGWDSDGWGSVWAHGSARTSSTTFGVAEGTTGDKIAARQYVQQRKEREAASRDAMLEALLWKSSVGPGEVVSGEVVYAAGRARSGDRYVARVMVDGIGFVCELEPRQ